MDINNENLYAIELDDVYKHYRIYRDKGNELKEKILFWRRNKYTKNKRANCVKSCNFSLFLQ